MDFSRAEIIVIGNEILSGKRIDSNSAFIGWELSRIGIEVAYKTTVRDDGAELGEAVRRAVKRSPLVITSGGLGPTIDDLTRPILSEAVGIPLRLDRELLQEIKQKFISRGLPYAETNESQARVPEKGRYFPNPNGTAPGLLFEGDGFAVAALPGPPPEMRPIVTNYLLPYLTEQDPNLSRRREKVYQLTGTGESNIDEELRTFFPDAGPVAVSSLPRLGWVTVSFTQLEVSGEAKERFEQLCGTFEERFSKLIFGGEGDTLESVVGRTLKEKSATLATAESCTGGLIGGRITEVSGSSEYFLGSVVAYGNKIKQRMLRVSEEVLLDHGAVSEPTAKAMAEGVREALGADYGLSCTGIAGPSGGTDEKPVGLVYLAFAGPSGTKVEEHRFFGERAAVRERSVIAGLDLARREIAAFPVKKDSDREG